LCHKIISIVARAGIVGDFQAGTNAALPVSAELTFYYGKGEVASALGGASIRK
jgi:hypothetical protein